MKQRRYRRRRWMPHDPHLAGLDELQRRAEAMTLGDFSTLGQPVAGAPELENLRRALDVMGAHIEQAQQGMHDSIAVLTTAQEVERGRIARDLHDDTVQRLIALGQGIERAQRVLQRDPSLADERLRALRTDVTALVQTVRGIIAELRPPALDELGLLPAVELLLKRTDDESPEVTMVVAGTARRLDAQSELALFRIIQEAWSNIRRHAQAQQVRLHFHYTRNALVVTVQDDGRGFEAQPPTPTHRGGYGLLGMHERAALVGGTLQVESHPGQGTWVEVHMPYLGLEGRDPVCSMEVGPEALSIEHENQLYRFCSAACRDLFVAQPARYAHRMPLHPSDDASTVE
jgi:signal transduction histidine kinase/YHS domain-containing protein